MMPFDPLELLLEMESEITDNMIALLSRDAVASAEWQAARLAEIGAFRAMNERTVKKYLKKIQARLAEYYAAVGTDAVLSARIPGLADVLPDDAAASLSHIWLVWETQTMNTLKKLGMTLIAESQDTYIRIVYKSAAKMLSGSSTLRGAIAETATEWLENGIPALRDKAGRNWSVEAYAQTVLRSNERQVVTASQDAAFDRFGVDLVEISSHLGARPLCAPYQGRVFSRSGTSAKYPALSKTSRGQIAGLFGINCGHTMYAFDPDAGRTYKPYPAKENDAAYKASQRQRLLERNIRKAKKDLSIAQISGDEKIIARAQKRVKDARANMREFIDDSGRTRRRDREQIY